MLKFDLLLKILKIIKNRSFMLFNVIYVTTCSFVYLHIDEHLGSSQSRLLEKTTYNSSSYAFIPAIFRNSLCKFISLFHLAFNIAITCIGFTVVGEIGKVSKMFNASLTLLCYIEAKSLKTRI